MRKNLFRWAALLPSAVIAGVLATFPLHWILSLKSSYDGTFLGFIELSPEAFITIERTLSPFVIAIVFILVGAKIAPTNKFKTAIVLAIIYIIFFIGTLFFAVTSNLQISLEARSLGPIFGLLLGLYIVWREYKDSNSLYFAYGSNMNSERMSNACKNGKYKVLGNFKLKGCRFEYNGHSQKWRGPAGDIIKFHNDHVVGVLYEIDEQCKLSLNISEGYRKNRDMSKNTYKPIKVGVIGDDGNLVQNVLTYVHVNTEKKEKLNCEYKNLLIKGAREHDLPEDYITRYLDVERCEYKK